MIINKLKKAAVQGTEQAKVLVYDGNAEYNRYASNLNRIARDLNNFKPLFDEALSETGLVLNMEVLNGGWDLITNRVIQYINGTSKALRAYQDAFYKEELNKLHNGFYNIATKGSIQDVPAGLEYQLPFIFLNNGIFEAKPIDSDLFNKYISADLYDDLAAYCEAQNKLFDRFGDRINSITSALKPDSENLKIFYNADITQIGKLAKIFNL